MNRLLLSILLLLPAAAIASSPKPNTSAQFERNDTQPNAEPKEWVTGVHATTPNWAVNSSPNHFIGVSDPCLNSEDAFTQAVNRALFMAMLSKGATVEILFEDIKEIKNIAIHDYTTDKYVRIVNLYTFGKQSYFEIGRTEQNIFGETFVELIEQSTPTQNSVCLSNSDSFGCNIKYMSISDEEVLLDSKFTMSYIESNNNASYSIKDAISIEKERGGERNTKRTIFGEEHSIIGDKHTWYSNNTSSRTITNIHLFTGTPMRDGYWCAFLESLIHGVINEPAYPFTMKSMMQNGGDIDNIENARSIYKGTISVKLAGALIYDELLRSKWIISIK